MLLYIYILYVSTNALQFSVIGENIKAVFERLGFFSEFEWSFDTYLIIHAKYQKPLRQI